MRLGKAVCKGPLIDHGLLEWPWQINESRTVDDSVAHQLLAKYPGLFKHQKHEDRIFDKMTTQPRIKPDKKPYEDKIQRPKGVK